MWPDEKHTRVQRLNIQNRERLGKLISDSSVWSISSN